MSDDTNIVEQGETAAPEQEFVPLDEASDEDINQYLESPAEAKKEERETDTPPEEEKPEEAKAQPAPDKEEALRKANAELQARLEKQQKLLEQSERFNKRRSTELGETRKALKEAQSRLSQLMTEENYQLNPSQAVKAQLKYNELEQQVRATEAEEARLARLTDGHSTLAKHVDLQNVPYQDIAEILIEQDGLDPDFVREFLPGMMQFNGIEPETTLQVIKRAELWNRAKKVVEVAAAEIAKRDAEIAKLKGQPEAMLKNVQRALKSGPQVTAASGGGTNGADRSIPSDPASWSDAQLEEFLQRNK